MMTATSSSRCGPLQPSTIASKYRLFSLSVAILIILITIDIFALPCLLLSPSLLVGQSDDADSSTHSEEFPDIRNNLLENNNPEIRI
jgi:hypothetical protein